MLGVKIFHGYYQIFVCPLSNFFTVGVKIFTLTILILYLITILKHELSLARFINLKF